MSLADGYHDLPRGKIAMVVTHLEMRARPALRDAPLHEGLRFAPLAREPESYRALFRRIGEDWLWFARLRLTDLELCTIIEDPRVALWTLEKDGRPEALLELDFRETGACLLAYFGLTPALIGTGAGAWLMDRAIEMAWAEDIVRFHVHTCTLDSPQALGFYIRSGFVPVARQVEIFDDPRRLGFYPAGAAPHVPLI